MKIAIPIDKNDINSNVCVSFGRAPYFLLLDTVKGTSNIIQNYSKDETSGAGLKTAQMIVDNDVHSVITLRCGINSAQVLKAANINIFKASDIKAINNLSLYDQLIPLTDFNAGHHGGR